MILVPVSREAFLPFLICSLIAGMIFGAVYELFRVRRVAFGRKSGALSTFLISIEDIVFCIFVAVTMILICYKLNYGVPRWYSYGAAALGVLLWRKTGGRLVMRASELIISLVRRLLSFVIDKIILPPLKTITAKARNIKDKIENNRARAYTNAYEKRILDSICVPAPERSTEKL